MSAKKQLRTCEVCGLALRRQGARCHKHRKGPCAVCGQPWSGSGGICDSCKELSAAINAALRYNDQPVPEHEYTKPGNPRVYRVGRLLPTRRVRK